MTATIRALATLAILLVFAATARAQFIVLEPTGEMRDGLPVLRSHPDASAVEAVLTRGFSGRLVRLYALEQEFLRRKTGRASEPAYLALTNRQGGFPQFGFCLWRAAPRWTRSFARGRLATVSFATDLGTRSRIVKRRQAPPSVRQPAKLVEGSAWRQRPWTGMGTSDSGDYVDFGQP